jgi:hypothetical protein
LDHEIAQMDRNLKSLRAEIRTAQSSVLQSKLLLDKDKESVDRIQGELESMKPTDNSQIAAWERQIEVAPVGKNMTHQLRSKMKRNVSR